MRCASVRRQYNLRFIRDPNSDIRDFSCGNWAVRMLRKAKQRISQLGFVKNDISSF